LAFLVEAMDHRKLMPGSLELSRYALRHELGRGGACSVVEGVHRITGRVVAIKQLLPEVRQRADVRARLFREAEALGAIRHPNVVDILDAGEDEDGVPYLVLERLHGRTLEGILAARQHLEIRDAMTIAWQTCAALSASHAVAVVHRDVKPENMIIVGDDGARLIACKVKLIDFGIATAPRGTANPQKLTRPGGVLGTAEYLPPELLEAGSQPLPAADVYAVGVTLYECLAGRVPVAGTARQIKEKLAQSPAPPVEAFRKDVPKALSLLLGRALAKDPERRYPTPQALAEALAQIATDMETAPLARMASAASVPAVKVPREVPIELRHSGPAPTSPASRRKTKRAPYRTPVRLELDTGQIDAKSEDLSKQGICILIPEGAPRPSAVGARAGVRFASPTTGEMLTLPGTVRWMKVREHAGTAIGVEFSYLDPRIREGLERFVDIVGRDVEE
jgi:serine/threonine-protein kinase